MNIERFTEYLGQEITQLQLQVDIMNARLDTMKNIRKEYLTILKDEKEKVKP